MRDPSARSGLVATIGPEMVALALTIVLIVGVMVFVGYGALTGMPGPSAPVASPTAGPSTSVSDGGPSFAGRADRWVWTVSLPGPYRI